MLLIVCVEERLLHIGTWQPLFSKKVAAAASFSYKICGSGLIFLQNWWRQQGFGNITGGCSDMVWILEGGRLKIWEFSYVFYWKQKKNTPPLCPSFWGGSSAASPLKIWDVMPPYGAIPEETFKSKKQKIDKKNDHFIFAETTPLKDNNTFFFLNLHSLSRKSAYKTGFTCLGERFQSPFHYFHNYYNFSPLATEWPQTMICGLTQRCSTVTE